MYPTGLWWFERGGACLAKYKTLLGHYYVVYKETTTTSVHLYYSAVKEQKEQFLNRFLINRHRVKGAFVQLQQPKPFPLQVREFSDCLDIFGAWCVLGAWRRSTGIGERSKRSSEICLWICVFYLGRGVLTLYLYFLQVDTWEEINLFNYLPLALYKSIFLFFCFFVGFSFVFGVLYFISKLQLS